MAPQATLFLKPCFSITLAGAALSVAVSAEPGKRAPEKVVSGSKTQQPGA